MSKADEIEDKEFQDMFKFLILASKVCKEKGKHYEFECPLCKSKAVAIKNTYNGHLWAKCNGCEVSVMQ